MEIVELRVHGVHGTSPASMLGVTDGEVGQVAGDGLTGIYRTKDGTLPLRDLDGTHVSVEAYSWGALTSGVQGFLGWVRRALWLVLLPFALVNLAYWARLGLGRRGGQAQWGARAVRLSGLLLTVFFVVTPCVVAIDMGAWQCFRYGVPGCSSLPGWLDFLGGLGPAQRMALATSVPMALVGVLWLLSRTSISRYESVLAAEYSDATPGPDTPDAPDTPDTPEQVLLHPHLWDGKERTLRLQRFHLTAAIATIVAFTGIHLLHAGAGRLTFWSAAGLGLCVLLAAQLLDVAVIGVCANHPKDVDWSGQYGEPNLVDLLGTRLGARFDKGVALAAVAVYLLHLLVLWTLGVGTHQHLDESIDYTWRNVWFIGLFVLLTVLHLSVFTGGRMGGRAATAIALSPLVIVIVIQVLRLSGLYDSSSAWFVLGAVVVSLAFWGLLAFWQYHRSPASNSAAAWRGAGASVLLATAAWVALLFTTGTVVAAANFLNGSAHGVGDQVSQVEVPDKSEPAPTMMDLTSKQSTDDFVATGEVTLRDARVTLDGDTATVTSGTVEMKGLSLRVRPGYTSGTDAFTEGRGRTVLREKASTITVPARGLVLADSCLGRGRGACTPEDQDDQFRPAGVLTLPGADGPFTLTLGKGVVLDPSDRPEVPLAVPQVLIWTAIGQLLWLVLVAVFLGVCLRRFGRHVGQVLEDHYSEDDTWLEEIAPRDRARCVSARRTAALTHRAETLLDVVGAITAPVALIIIVTSMCGAPPWELPGFGWTRSVATASMWLVVGMSAGLVALSSQIRRSEKTRKAVGVIWDLTTFWPRAAHPLAPPCYAERVIPELLVRSRWALDRHGEVQPHEQWRSENRLILSGHSQGSLIVLSAASRLGQHELARTRVVTYGSQIRQLYGRIFPRVFGPDAIGNAPTTGQPLLSTPVPDLARTDGLTGPEDDPSIPPGTSFRGRLRAAGGEWVNLFRRTDPIGWRVFSDRDSEFDLPVPEVPADGVGDPGPRIQGHSNYQHSRVYRAQVARWTHEDVVEDPVGTGRVPDLPPA
jgi:hypothetical protein